MLLSGTAEVIGPGHDGLVVINSDYGLVCVLGRPDVGDIREAISRLSGRRAVISAPEDRDHVAEALPEYKPVTAVVHLPGGNGLRLPDVPPNAVRLLARSSHPDRARFPVVAGIGLVFKCRV
jgi:hypothetical protein